MICCPCIVGFATKGLLADCTVQYSDSTSSDDVLMTHYLGLTPRQQYLALVLLDFVPNIVVLGISNMNLPFQFKTVAEWQRLLQSNGLRPGHIQMAGFEIHRMHPSCRAWILCDSI